MFNSWITINFSKNIWWLWKIFFVSNFVLNYISQCSFASYKYIKGCIGYGFVCFFSFFELVRSFTCYFLRVPRVNGAHCVVFLHRHVWLSGDCFLPKTKIELNVYCCWFWYFQFLCKTSSTHPTVRPMLIGIFSAVGLGTANDLATTARVYRERSN